MKTKFNLIFMLAIVSLTINSQTENKPIKPRANHFSLGYSINQFGKDFGLGLAATTPFIANSIAFRVSENYMWCDYYDGSNTIWRGYHNVKLGVVTTAAIINNQIRVYAEGGVLMLITDKAFSSQSYSIGGYGVFGFEFLLRKMEDAHMSYFIEMGGMGTGAVAEKLATKPILSNGFLMSTGFKIYF